MVFLYIKLSVKLWKLEQIFYFLGLNCLTDLSIQPPSSLNIHTDIHTHRHTHTLCISAGSPTLQMKFRLRDYSK